MNYKKMYIVVSSSLMILICLVYQGTYSWYVAGLNDTRGENKEPSTMTTIDLQNLVLAGNNTSDDYWIPGYSKDFTFNITNPGSAEVCFNLKWENVVNTFENKQDLVVTLKKEDGTVILEETPFPDKDGLLKQEIAIAPKVTDNYILNITYKNTTEDQFGDMGKSFSAAISGDFTTCSK